MCWRSCKKKLKLVEVIFTEMNKLKSDVNIYFSEVKFEDKFNLLLNLVYRDGILKQMSQYN